MLTLMLYMKAKQSHKQKDSSWPNKYPALGEQLNKYSHTIESRTPPLFQVCFTSFFFLEKRTLPVFAHWKKSKDYVHFYEKRHSVKIAFSTALQWAIIEVAHAQRNENSAHKTLPWEPHSAPQPQAAMALNCVTVCALSQFILCIPLARCVQT